MILLTYKQRYLHRYLLYIPFSMIDDSSGCQSEDDILVIVGPDFSLDACCDTLICDVAGVPLSVTTSPGNYSYQWTPSDVVQDSSQQSTVATPVTSTEFMVKVTSDSGCIKHDTVSVSIARFIGFSMNPDSVSLCVGDTVQPSYSLSSLCGVSPVTCSANQTILGNGNLSTSGTTVTPFTGSFQSSKRQYIILQSELAAMGLSGPTSISSLAFDVISIIGTITYENFTIKIGCTSASAAALTFIPGLETVFFTKDVVLNTGWYDLPFDIAYDWDGVSNLVIEICYDNSFSSSNSSVRYYYPGFTATTARWSSTSVCANTAGSTYIQRPFIRLSSCPIPTQSLSYNWTPTNGVSDPAIPNPVITAVQPQVYTVQVTDDSSGCFVTEVLIVHVESSDSFNLQITMDTMMCSTSGFQLTASFDSSGPLNYSWSPASLVSDPFLKNPTLLYDTTALYIFGVSDTSGCANSFDTVSVGQFIPEQLSLSNDTLECTGDTISLSVTNGVNHVWTPNPGLIISDPLEPQVAASAGSWYYVSAQDSNGCSVGDSVYVAVIPLPTVDLGPDTHICDGQLVVLDAGNSFSQFSWSNGDSTQSLSVSSASDYSVTVTDNFGCENQDTVYVSIQTLPTITVSDDTSLCSGETVILTASANTGSVIWSTHDTTLSISTQNSGDYIAATIDSVGCTAQDTVTVIFTPLPPVNLGPDITICDYDSTILIAGLDMIYIYDWSTGNTDSSIVIDTAGTYSVIVTDTNGCQDFDTVSVQQTAPPFVDIGPDTTICAGEVVSLNAGNPGLNFNWSGGQSSQIIQVTIADTYWVEVTDNNNCASFDTMVLDVQSLPVITISQDTLICPRGICSVSCQCSYSFGLSMVNPVATLSQEDIPNPLASPVNNQVYTVTVSDSLGCQSIATVLVSVTNLPCTQFRSGYFFL